jgi:hypothetical protein
MLTKGKKIKGMSYHIIAQTDRKLEIGHGNKSEYTVLMYLEVLCTLCFDNTVTKSNEG